MPTYYQAHDGATERLSRSSELPLYSRAYHQAHDGATERLSRSSELPLYLRAYYQAHDGATERLWRSVVLASVLVVALLHDGPLVPTSRATDEATQGGEAGVRWWQGQNTTLHPRIQRGYVQQTLSRRQNAQRTQNAKTHWARSSQRIRNAKRAQHAGRLPR